MVCNPTSTGKNILIIRTSTRLIKRRKNLPPFNETRQIRRAAIFFAQCRKQRALRILPSTLEQLHDFVRYYSLRSALPPHLEGAATSFAGLRRTIAMEMTWSASGSRFCRTIDLDGYIGNGQFEDWTMVFGEILSRWESFLGSKCLKRFQKLLSTLLCLIFLFFQIRNCLFCLFNVRKIKQVELCERSKDSSVSFSLVSISTNVI